jgi:hypothetical protein
VVAASHKVENGVVSIVNLWQCLHCLAPDELARISVGILPSFGLQIPQQPFQRLRVCNVRLWLVARATPYFNIARCSRLAIFYVASRLIFSQ